MTTATALTWPTVADLELVSAILTEASRAVDELHLKYFKLDEAMVGEGDLAPSLETLGALSCFLEYADMDLKAIQSHLDTIREAFHSGAVERGDLGLRSDEKAAQNQGGESGA